MTGFLIRRTGQALFVLFLVTVFTLALVHLFPGGPVRALLGPRATPALITYYNHLYGFDQPFYVQYIKWVGQLLHGNLGFSDKLNQSVTSLIAQDLPKTIILVLLGTVVSLLFGIPLGVYQAVQAQQRRRLRADRHLVPRLLHPDVLPRPPPGRLVLRRHPPVPAVRAAGHHGRPDPVPDPRALVLPVFTYAFLLYALWQPVHALLGAGQPGAGLRAHRAGQGRQRAAGDLGPRLPQLAGLDRHPARPVAAHAGRRRDPHRGRCSTIPGMGLAFYQAALNVDYQVAARVHRARHAGDDRGEPAGRHRLRGARPEGEVH